MRLFSRFRFAHPSLRGLLSGAFVGIALLSLAVSSLGIWGMQHVAQSMTTIIQQSLPQVKAISDVRAAILTYQSNDRQALFETNVAQIEADLELLPVDAQSLQGAIDQFLRMPHIITASAQITQLQQALATWLRLPTDDIGRAPDTTRGISYPAGVGWRGTGAFHHLSGGRGNASCVWKPCH